MLSLLAGFLQSWNCAGFLPLFWRWFCGGAV